VCVVCVALDVSLAILDKRTEVSPAGRLDSAIVPRPRLICRGTSGGCKGGKMPRVDAGRGHGGAKIFALHQPIS
jgi:hypothetical protein